MVALRMLHEVAYAPKAQMEETMKKTLFLTLVITLAIGVAFAQSRGNGPANGGNGSQSGSQTPAPQFDVTQLVTIDGTVVNFAAAAGAGTPQLTVQRATENFSFVLGPYRYLTSQNFVARAGDSVRVAAWPCSTCPSGYAVKEVQNLTAGVTLALRDANGLPLFTSGGPGNGGHGQGSGNGGANGPHRGGNGMGGGQGLCAGSGPDMTAVRTYSGTVKSFTGGYGAGTPTLVLASDAGDVSIVVSPFRAIAVSEFTIKEGMRLNVTTAPVKLATGDHWVAIRIEEPATGFAIDLRDATTGLPLYGRR